MDISAYPIRVLVCGGRRFTGRALLQRWLNEAVGAATQREVLVIHGAATGADTLADEIAKANGIAVKAVPADWSDISHRDAVVCVRRDGTLYDRCAGRRRNQRMLVEGRPTICVAMPGDVGTADMVRRARRAGVKVIGPGAESQQ